MSPHSTIAFLARIHSRFLFAPIEGTFFCPAKDCQGMRVIPVMRCRGNISSSPATVHTYLLLKLVNLFFSLALSFFFCWCCFCFYLFTFPLTACLQQNQRTYRLDCVAIRSLLLCLSIFSALLVVALASSVGLQDKCNIRWSFVA